jgi:hypothetical protein
MGLLDIVVWDYDATIYGLSYAYLFPHILLLSINNNISKIYVDKMWITLWISVDKWLVFIQQIPYQTRRYQTYNSKQNHVLFLLLISYTRDYEAHF